MELPAINTRLDRDTRYAAAAARLAELRVQLSALERERDDTLSALNGLGSAPRALDRIKEAAAALLSDADAAVLPSQCMQAEQLRASYANATDSIAVLRQAIEMQGQVVEKWRCVVSRAICADLAATHKANVRAIISAALALAEAVRVEADLRDDLTQNGVYFSGDLRPMPIRGFNLKDPNGRLMAYLLEAEVNQFITAAELPASVQAHVVPRAEPQQKTAPRNANADGWLNA